MRNITITFLLISNLIFSQDTQSDCQPMFNSKLFSFEGESLENLDTKLHFLKDENYQINFDLSEFVEGKRSVCVKGLSQNTTTHAAVSINVPIKIKKNSKVELSVWVKTDSVHGNNSGTILRLTGYGNNRSTKPTIFKFSEGILKGSSDWTKMSLATILKEDEHLITLSGLMQGKGKVWFDKFELKINGEKIHDILFFKDVEEENKIKKTLKKYVRPLKIKKLKQISNFVSTQKKEVKIIGVGEATHGTKEVYEYKIKIIKALIKNNGARKIALESYYANTDNLNTYIQTGKGKLKKRIAGLYWPYYTVQFKKFLIWLKKYNKKTNNKVSIIGIDSQPRGNSLKVLTKKLKDNTPFAKLLSKLNNDSIKIAQKINNSNKLLQKLLKSNQNRKILMNARELSQSYFLEQYIGHLKYHRLRDSIMAVNIGYLEKELPANEKIIYWAHDEHIQKKQGFAGGFLKAKFKDSYVNIGFLLGKGKYTAINKESGKVNSDNYLTPVNCNSLENLMQAYNKPVLLLNNNSAVKDSYLNNNLFNKYLVKRSIGALAINSQFNKSNDDKENLFDLLIYIKDSNPSQLLKKIKHRFKTK